VTAAALAALLVLPGQLVMRGHLDPPPGEVLGVDARGARVGELGDESSVMIVGWHLVEDVQGPRAEEADAFDQLAEDAWRAVSRLDRGDAYAAEPIFERRFPGLREQGGPTAEAVIQGLLRCRLRRGAHAGAIEPWLELVDIRTRDPDTPWFRPEDAFRAAAPIDERTFLAPALPPIWFDAPAVRELATAPPPPPDPRGPTLASRLRELYVAAARDEIGQPARLPADPPPEHTRGYFLVRDIVLSRLGPDGDRKLARARLESRIEGATPHWIEAWVRAAVGRSLLLETDVGSRMLGIIHLLHLPARFGEEHPYLAGIALAEAADALEDLNKPEGAATLREELARQYPDHPILIDRGASDPLARRAEQQ